MINIWRDIMKADNKLLLETKKALCDIVNNEDNTRLYVFNRGKGSIAIPMINTDKKALRLNQNISNGVKHNHAM